VGDVAPVSATGSRAPARDAARAAQPDPARAGDRGRRRRWRRRQPQVPPLRGLRGPIGGHGPLRSIAARGAAAFGHTFGPVAFVPSLPPRKNAKPWKPDTPEPIARNGGCGHPGASAGPSGDDGEGPARPVGVDGSHFW
jgi:hypothetical protein